MLHISFYKFVEIEDPNALADTLRTVCEEHDLLGTILIAKEGINGMITGPNTEVLATWFAQYPPLSDMRLHRTECDEMPFGVLKIKIKPEIVTLRQGEVTVPGATAPHLPPEQFRDWLRSGEDMVLIDVRNDFEYHYGTFRGALNPETVAFHEFPRVVAENIEAWRDKRVVTFCTGGIRCEKATAWMLEEHGFKDLYQIKGGVLGYFEEIEDAHKDWEGSLFVFDEREALDTRRQAVGSEVATESDVR